MVIIEGLKQNGWEYIWVDGYRPSRRKVSGVNLQKNGRASAEIYAQMIEEEKKSFHRRAKKNGTARTDDCFSFYLTNDPSVQAFQKEVPQHAIFKKFKREGPSYGASLFIYASGGCQVGRECLIEAADKTRFTIGMKDYRDVFEFRYDVVLLTDLLCDEQPWRSEEEGFHLLERVLHSVGLCNYGLSFSCTKTPLR